MDPTSHPYVGFTDGASRWSSNLASVAWVIYSLSHELIYIDEMCVGISTNNQDEYNGVVCLLTATLHLGVHRLGVEYARLEVTSLRNVYTYRIL